MFASTADELLRYFRAEASDAVEPYLWEDWEAYGYMTEGFDALLKQANVVYRTHTVAFAAAQSVVPLPAKLLHIRHAKLVGGDTLDPVNANQVVAYGSDYGLNAPVLAASYTGTGTPCAYLRDYENRAIRLLPTPVAAGEVELQATVTLGVPMESGAPLPSLDTTDLRLVLHYMKSLAYQKQEAETEDLVRAKFHEARYREGALDREQQLRNIRRTPGTVRMQGW